MRLKSLAGILVFVLFLLVIPILFAVQSNINDIKSEYYPEDALQGWVNISLSNELKTSELKAVFSDGLTQTASLISFISGQTINYSCTTKNCSDDYKTKDTGELSKTIDLVSSASSALLGIKINGENIDIKSFEFNFLSDAEFSCTNQLKIDITGDNSVDWVNKKITDETCGNQIKSLCNTGSFSVQGTITNVPYCEKIKLPLAPAFKIKAGIQKQGTSVFYDGLLIARIFDSSGSQVGDCNLSNPISNSNYAQCDIDYSVKTSAEYYLCVSYKENYVMPGESVSSYDYKLSASQSGTHCGFLGDPAVSPDLSATYDITAYAKKYSSIGSVKINDTSFAEQNSVFLINYLNDYLLQKYNKDCSNDCIIPIEFKGISQKLTINNLLIKYNSQGIADISESNLYGLERTPAKISFNYSRLDLGRANFKVPSQYGNYTLKLFLGATQIAEKNISVIKKEISPIMQLYPRNIAVLNPTKFTVFLNPSFNLSDVTFKWDFGDGSPIDATGANNVKHTFDSIGNYTVKIALYKGSAKVSSKSFIVSAQSPINAINTTIIKYKKDILNFKSQFDSLSASYKEKINENLDIANMELQLTDLERAYKQAVSSGATDLEYVGIMGQLITLKVPTAIQPSEINDINLIDDLDIVDAETISELFGDSGCINDEECNNAIVKWSMDEVDINVVNRILSVYYTDSIEDVMSEFEIKISPKELLSYKGYLIINENREDLIFDGNYDISENSGDITGITFDLSGENAINFALAEQTNIFSLPFYVSPELKELAISSPPGTTKPKSIWQFVLIFILLIFLAVAAYIFLKKWYRKNYESSLFKNKNDLANLLLFMRNAKLRNIPESEIKTKLKKTGWKREQVNHAIKKFHGKEIWPSLFSFKKKTPPLKNPLTPNPFIKKP